MTAAAARAAGGPFPLSRAKLLYNAGALLLLFAPRRQPRAQCWRRRLSTAASRAFATKYLFFAAEQRAETAAAARASPPALTARRLRVDVGIDVVFLLHVQQTPLSGRRLRRMPHRARKAKLEARILKKTRELGPRRRRVGVVGLRRRFSVSSANGGARVRGASAHQTRIWQ